MQDLNILITSGGVETALNIIKCLNRSTFNCRIVTSDMDADSLGRHFSNSNYITPKATEINFIEEIIEIVRKEKIDFIFPCHSSEISVFCEALESLRSEGVGLILPNLSAESICSNKKSFLDFLAANKFKTATTFQSFDQVRDFPIFIRPKIGSSSNGAALIECQSQITKEQINNQHNLIIQQYISAEEVTIDAYRNNDKEFFACIPRIRQKVKDGKSVVAETIDDPRIQKIVQTLLNRLDFNGACNIQLFLDDDLSIIEINPRMSAGGLLLACEAGLNIPELMLMDYLNMPLPEIQPPSRPIKMLRYLDEIFIR
jgi:carbamoyl-phosphate synthase large subunit